MGISKPSIYIRIMTMYSCQISSPCHVIKLAIEVHSRNLHWWAEGHCCRNLLRFEYPVSNRQKEGTVQLANSSNAGAQHDVLVIYHGARWQSPDTNKPRAQGVKRQLCTDQWQFDALIQVKSLAVMGRSDICGKQSEFIIQMYAVVSCPHKNLRVVHY